MGAATLIYLAGLQSIPGELYEAPTRRATSGSGFAMFFPAPAVAMVVLLCCKSWRPCRFIEPYQLTGSTNPDTIRCGSDLPLRLQCQRDSAGRAMSVLLFVVPACSPPPTSAHRERI